MNLQQVWLAVGDVMFNSNTQKGTFRKLGTMGTMLVKYLIYIYISLYLADFGRLDHLPKASMMPLDPAVLK